MKTLRESLQSSLNESIEGMLQSRADILARNGNTEDEDGYNMIRLTNPVELGENSACIDSISSDGTIVRVDIDGSTDAIQTKYFADEILKAVVKELDMMAKKIK